LNLHLKVILFFLSWAFDLFRFNPEFVGAIGASNRALIANWDTQASVAFRT